MIHHIWFARILRTVLGLLFINAGYSRLEHPHMIAQHLGALDIFPWAMINFFAMWMLAFEIVVGILLITGIWLRAVSILAVAFTMMCTCLVTFALSEGLSLHCGCFVTSATGAARTWASLWQEAFLLFSTFLLVSAAFSRSRQ